MNKLNYKARGGHTPDSLLLRWRSRGRAVVCGLGLLAAAAVVQARALTGSPSQWQEGEVPPPPAPRLDQPLLELPLPRQSSVQLLIDRDSLDVTYPDGVVRYVAVLRGSNTQTVLYQGIRCSSDEVRTYARYDLNAQPAAWVHVNSDWQDIGSLRTPYTRAIVRAGACDNRTAPVNSGQLRRIFGTQPQWQGR